MDQGVLLMIGTGGGWLIARYADTRRAERATINHLLFRLLDLRHIARTKLVMHCYIEAVADVAIGTSAALAPEVMALVEQMQRRILPEPPSDYAKLVFDVAAFAPDLAHQLSGKERVFLIDEARPMLSPLEAREFDRAAAGVLGQVVEILGDLSKDLARRSSARLWWRVCSDLKSESKLDDEYFERMNHATSSLFPSIEQQQQVLSLTRAKLDAHARVADTLQRRSLRS
jgi:hypothetical protein